MTRITPQEAREWHENAALNLEGDIDLKHPWAHIHSEQVAKHRTIAALIQEMEEALKFYSDPFGKCEEVPDFYDELGFGERAAAIFQKDKDNG